MGFGDTQYKKNEDFWHDWCSYYAHERKDWTLERVAYNTVKFSKKGDQHRWAVMHHDTIIVEQWQATLLAGAHPDAMLRVTVTPWDSNTTRDRINDHAPGMNICTHRGTQYFTAYGPMGGVYEIDSDDHNIEYDVDGRGNVVQFLDPYVPMLTAPWASMHKLEKKLRRVISAAGRACPPVSVGRFYVRPGVSGALLDESAAWAGTYIPDYQKGEEARLGHLEAFIAQLEVIGKINPQWLYSRRENIAHNCGMRAFQELSVEMHGEEGRKFIKSAVDQYAEDKRRLTFGDVEAYKRAWEKLQEAAR